MVVFPELVQLKVPAGFSAAVSRAAHHRHMTRSEYARRALLERLAEDGMQLHSDPPADTHSGAPHGSVG